MAVHTESPCGSRVQFGICTLVHREGRYTLLTAHCCCLRVQPTHLPAYVRGELNAVYILNYLYLEQVPTGTPSRGGEVAVFVFDINQPSLPTAFYTVLASISVLMALSTVFHSTNSPDNFPFSDSVLPVLFLRSWSFQLYISL